VTYNKCRGCRRKKVMWKITGDRECSRIEYFGMGAGERRRERQHGPERQRCSKAAHGQKNWKAQQERGVVKRRSEEPSKC